MEPLEFLRLATNTFFNGGLGLAVNIFLFWLLIFWVLYMRISIREYALFISTLVLLAFSIVIGLTLPLNILAVIIFLALMSLLLLLFYVIKE